MPAPKKTAARTKPKSPRKSRPPTKLAPAGRDAIFATASSKKIAHDFVLDELETLAPVTKPMFGCTAVYVGESIVMVLRGRGDEDDGVWVATTKEHHDSLRRELPSMRSITVLGNGGVTGWQVLPSASLAFEDEVLRACAMVRARDPRIGKLPKRKTSRRPSR